jgi:hypothetical protein
LVLVSLAKGIVIKVKWLNFKCKQKMVKQGEISKRGSKSFHLVLISWANGIVNTVNKVRFRKKYQKEVS